MGCTSSAPNMANTSTAEKSIQFEEEYSEETSRDVEEIIYRATDEIKVLPSCDTLPELVHLVRNKSTPSLKDETDNTESGHLSEIIKKVQSNEKLDQEEKVPRLEEVVEKVVELHIKAEHVEDIQTTEKVVEDSSKTEEITDKHSLKEGNNEDKNGHTSDEKDKKDDEHPAEALSPSQSESSRATRWEALADIAAELPPSLTVDPITGQIYTLYTK